MDLHTTSGAFDVSRYRSREWAREQIVLEQIAARAVISDAAPRSRWSRFADWLSGRAPGRPYTRTNSTAPALPVR